MIVGRLIPAGTGLAYHTERRLREDENIEGEGAEAMTEAATPEPESQEAESEQIQSQVVPDSSSLA